MLVPVMDCPFTVTGRIEKVCASWNAIVMFETMTEFQEAMKSLHPAWQVWTQLLLLMNLVVPLIFFKKKEAWISIGTILIQIMVMMLLFEIQGFTRLLGLAHFGWFGLIYYFSRRLPENPSNTLFGKWLRGVIVVNSISLLIDVTDVVRYLVNLMR